MSAIHLHQDEEGHWGVWLEPEEGDRFIGLCIGTAATKERAILDAILDLVTVTERLRRYTCGRSEA